MTPTVRRRPTRRRLASLLAAALVAGGVGAAVPSSALAATSIDDATFTWGLSGYAQKGIFGPWTFKAPTGNATTLTGSVSGGTQGEYVVDGLPSTSMPASSPQKTPNAVKFVKGAGTVDRRTGAADLSWSGSYTVNAYPAQFKAPDEIYADPELDVAADGSGTLTMRFNVGAGQDMEGNPTPATAPQRLTVATFDAGSVAVTGDGAIRVTPDYQGVQVDVPAEAGSAQTRACNTDGGATGTWGSWPADLVAAVPDSVRPHFYSTGCAGMQDNKPALPFDVAYSLDDPSVTVSKTTLLPTGEQQVTVTGRNFDPSLATGGRPPLAGKPAGTYVVFGRFADTWKPSAGATSAARPAASQKWAVSAADMATIGGANAGAVELTATGSFSTTLTIDKAAADAKSTTGTYGIYTYAGGGAVQPLYETATPVTFAKAPATVSVGAPTRTTYGAGFTITVGVTSSAPVIGTVTLRDGSTVVGTRTLTGGRATFALPASFGVGTHRLSATYSGADNLATAVSAARAVTVAKLGSSVNGSFTKRPTTKRAGTVKIRARSARAGQTPTGKVTVVVRKGKKRYVITKTLSKGVATLKVRKLAKGTWTVTYRYAGNGTHTTSTKAVKVKIMK
ncbi:Ig-like domain-containing protein [Solicola sp. PLA-1-18]|uniref:Ig-like domain-containing protein n=1 Tax=Solicola sp. PLA-1-18 TaxID=3380532 RepID=UPI003B82639A